jgi:hypothetical protein
MSARMRLATTSSAVTLAAWMMLGTTATLSASPIETPIAYSTYGAVDSVGVIGDPVLVFQGVPYATLTTGGTFDIGKFTVAATPGDGTANYTNIPFQIVLRAQAIDGSAPSPNETPIILQGTLSAVLTGGKIDSLTATFPTYSSDPANPPPFPTSVTPFRIGDFTSYLSITSSGNGGGSIQGTLNLAPVPEPTSMMVFAAAAGLVALRARRSRS